jgi:hypothetical protein
MDKKVFLEKAYKQSKATQPELKKVRAGMVSCKESSFGKEKSEEANKFFSKDCYLQKKYTVKTNNTYEE